MWASALYDFGLSSEAFLELTPRLFQALGRRRRKHLQREEILGGIIAATVANSGYWPRKQVSMPSDYVFSTPIERPQPKVQTTEDMFAVFDRAVGRDKAAGRIT